MVKGLYTHPIDKLANELLDLIMVSRYGLLTSNYPWRKMG